MTRSRTGELSKARQDHDAWSEEQASIRVRDDRNSDSSKAEAFIATLDTDGWREGAL